MKTRQINKNKPYYVAPGPIESMPNEPDVQKSRNEKYLKALQTLAEKDPEGFSNLAPELIKRSVWNLRGPDPYFSEKLENWKDQVFDMMKDLRTSIIDDVTELINKSMKQFMQEMTVSIKSNIVESMNTQTMINSQTNLTPLSQPERLTQSSQSTPQVRGPQQFHRRNGYLKVPE